jgi:hypothetical protein
LDSLHWQNKSLSILIISYFYQPLLKKKCIHEIQEINQSRMWNTILLLSFYKTHWLFDIRLKCQKSDTKSQLFRQRSPSQFSSIGTSCRYKFKNRASNRPIIQHDFALGPITTRVSGATFKTPNTTVFLFSVQLHDPQL